MTENAGPEIRNILRSIERSPIGCSRKRRGSDLCLADPVGERSARASLQRGNMLEEDLLWKNWAVLDGSGLHEFRCDRGRTPKYARRSAV